LHSKFLAGFFEIRKVYKFVITVPMHRKLTI
jgi:hypothetical protein